MTTMICTVEVHGRTDGTYLFADYDDAAVFADAVAKGRGDFNDGTDACVLSEEIVCEGEGAARLIAAERGDAIESMDGGWPELAEDVRSGVPVETCAARLAELGETETDAYKALKGWSK